MPAHEHSAAPWQRGGGGGAESRLGEGLDAGGPLSSAQLRVQSYCNDSDSTAPDRCMASVRESICRAIDNSTRNRGFVEMEGADDEGIPVFTRKRTGRVALSESRRD